MGTIIISAILASVCVGLLTKHGSKTTRRKRMSIQRTIPMDVFRELMDSLFEKSRETEDEELALKLVSIVLDKEVTESMMRFNPKGLAEEVNAVNKNCTQEQANRIFIALQEQDIIEAKKVGDLDGSEDMKSLLVDRPVDLDSSTKEGIDSGLRLISTLISSESEASKQARADMIELLSGKTREERLKILEKQTMAMLAKVIKGQLTNKKEDESNEA